MEEQIELALYNFPIFEKHAAAEEASHQLIARFWDEKTQPDEQTYPIKHIITGSVAEGFLSIQSDGDAMVIINGKIASRNSGKRGYSRQYQVHLLI